MSASLTGTMVDPDRLAQEQMELQRQRTEQAQQQAQQALSQYQGTAQAPPAQLSPLDTFLPTLVGNIASVIAQDPTYRQHGHEEVKRRQSELLKNRADTLQALQDNYNQKAKAALDAGDNQAHEEALLAKEKVSNAYQKVLDAQKAENDRTAAKTKQGYDLARDKAKSDLDLRNAKELARIKAEADSGAAAEAQQATFENDTKQTASGRQYLPLTNVKGVKPTAAARQYAATHGIPVVSAIDDDKLTRLDQARLNADDMIASLRKFLPKSNKDVGTMAHNTQQDLMGGDPEIRNYRQYYDALIEQLVAVAGGRGSGVRINRDEINRQVKIAPTIRTPLPIAEGWVRRVHQLIDNAEDPVLGRANLKTSNPKVIALKAARQGDIATLKRMIQANPELNDDEDLLRITQ
jgi:hypothetical protein